MSTKRINPGYGYVHGTPNFTSKKAALEYYAEFVNYTGVTDKRTHEYLALIKCVTSSVNDKILTKQICIGMPDKPGFTCLIRKSEGHYLLRDDRKYI